MDEITSLMENLKWRQARAAASAALARIGAPAVPALLDALETGRWQVRQEAARILGEIGDPRAVDALLTHLADTDVRRHAVRALGKIGDERAVCPLVAALGDEAEGVRGAAIEALVRIGEPAVTPLIAVLGHAHDARDADGHARQAATEALGHMGDARAVPVLVAALQDEDWQVRDVAVEVLGEIGDTRAIVPLLAALSHRARPWRWEGAAWALARIALRDPVPQLRAVLPFLSRLRESARTDSDRQTLRAAIARIEEVLSLPQPAFSPPPRAADLPRPALPPPAAESRAPGLSERWRRFQTREKPRG